MMQDDIRRFEPFWNKWYIVERLGSGSFGDVYRIKREEYGEVYYSALKVISIPRDRTELNAASLSCGSRENTMTYFDNMRQNIVKEINVMERLKGKTNIVSYEDHEILPKNGGKDPGYDIFIRMELLEDINDVAAREPALFHDNMEIVKIGRDMCRALKLCHIQNIIHRDIKPGNIFRSMDGDYKLGDFGIARSFSDNSLTMSVKGTFDYMAPEVYNRGHYDYRADIYSLGMLMYHMLNAFRGPFLSQLAGVPTVAEKEKALLRRMQGEDLPRPRYAFGRLAGIIVKACAFKPDDRYSDMKELKSALDNLEKDDYRRAVREGKAQDKDVEYPEERIPIVQDELTVGLPVLQCKEEDKKPELDTAQEYGKYETDRTVIMPVDKMKNKKTKYIIAVSLTSAVILLGGSLLFMRMSNKGERETWVKEDNNMPHNLLEEPINKLPEEAVIAMKPVCAEVKVKTVKIGQSLADAKISAEFQKSTEDAAKVSGEIKWSDEAKELEVSGEYEWIFYPEDTIAYESVTGTAWVTACITGTVTGIEEVEAVEDKKALVDVDLSDCRLEDISILDGADNLEFLTLDGNQLDSIELLKNCKNLRFISLVGNKNLSDITPILKLKKLQAVFLDETAVSSKDKERIQGILIE